MLGFCVMVPVMTVATGTAELWDSVGMLKSYSSLRQFGLRLQKGGMKRSPPPLG